jgi:hypothetical protein
MGICNSKPKPHANVVTSKTQPTVRIPSPTKVHVEHKVTSSANPKSSKVPSVSSRTIKASTTALPTPTRTSAVVSTSQTTISRTRAVVSTSQTTAKAAIGTKKHSYQTEYPSLPKVAPPSVEPRTSSRPSGKSSSKIRYTVGPKLYTTPNPTKPKTYTKLGVEIRVPFSGIQGQWVFAGEFAGKKSFGYYHCDCGKWWLSAHSYRKYYQECQICENECYPTYLWVNSDDEPSNKEAVPVDLSKPHDKSRCGACQVGKCTSYNNPSLHH